MYFTKQLQGLWGGGEGGALYGFHLCKENRSDLLSGTIMAFWVTIIARKSLRQCQPTAPLDGTVFTHFWAMIVIYLLCLSLCVLTQRPLL